MAAKLVSEVYVPSDVIIHQGQFVDSMMFISRGSIQVEVDDVAISVIHQGSYFGEVRAGGEGRYAFLRELCTEICGELYMMIEGMGKLHFTEGVNVPI